MVSFSGFTQGFEKLKPPCTLGIINNTTEAFTVRASSSGSKVGSNLYDRTNKRNKERGVKTIELVHIAVQ